MFFSPCAVSGAGKQSRSLNFRRQEKNININLFVKIASLKHACREGHLANNMKRKNAYRIY